MEKMKKDLEREMPGIEKMLADEKRITFTSGRVKKLQGVDYKESGEYKIVASKWERQTWGSRGGMEHVGWLEVFYTKKGKNEILKEKTPEIAVVDRYDARADRRDLALCNSVGIEESGTRKIIAYWKDSKDNRGPSYTIELK